MKDALIRAALVWSMVALAACANGGVGSNDGGGDGGSDGGGSSISVTGTVGGASLSGALVSASALRQPSTQLNPSMEPVLDTYVSAGLFALCPDIGTSSGASVLRVQLHGYTRAAGSFPVCDGFSCAAPYAEVYFEDGATSRRTRATGGSVVVAVSGSTATETLDATFEGGSLRGTFSVDASCTDARAR